MVNYVEEVVAPFLFDAGWPVWMSILVVYFFVAFSLRRIAQLTNTNHEYLAFIPFANVFLLTRIAKKNKWWSLLSIPPLFIFIPFASIVGLVIFWVWLMWIFFFIAQRLRFNKWSCFLVAVPIINVVYLGILAWKK